MGRPSIFNQATADYICEQLADGRSLRSITSDEDMPGRSTVFEWLNDNKEFADQYARAREALIDKMADDLLQISDEPVNLTMQGSTDTGAVQKQRLQVDTRKWLLSKMAPKKYGEKVELATDNKVQFKYGWEE